LYLRRDVLKVEDGSLWKFVLVAIGRRVRVMVFNTTVRTTQYRNSNSKSSMRNLDF
jgi:hypothetical protein